MSLELEVETIRRDADGYPIYMQATIEYAISGSYRAATRIDPEEYPEIEIESIAGEMEDGTKAALDESDFTAKEWAVILSAVAEDHNASQYDPAWDGPEEYDR